LSRYKPLKYKNIKVVIDGIKFDSKKEARRYSDLKLLERAGEISELELQPEFYFFIDGKPLKHKEKGARRIKYIADFRYTKEGETIVEDVKSPATAKDSLFRLKKALFETIYDMELTIV
jgi:hypothetical protein